MARMAEEKPLSPLHGPRPEVLGDRTAGFRGSAASQQDWGAWLACSWGCLKSGV